MKARDLFFSTVVALTAMSCSNQYMAFQSSPAGRAQQNKKEMTANQDKVNKTTLVVKPVDNTGDCPEGAPQEKKEDKHSNRGRSRVTYAPGWHVMRMN